jgi:hypothetical protein
MKMRSLWHSFDKHVAKSMTLPWKAITSSEREMLLKILPAKPTIILSIPNDQNTGFVKGLV